MKSEYTHDAFFGFLIGRMLEGVDELPCNKEVFGIPLTYNRETTEAWWEYTLTRNGVWYLTMVCSWNSGMTWKATGDLEAACRDLSLLKIAIC